MVNTTRVPKHKSYEQILADLQGSLSRSTEGLLRAGHLIHQARLLVISLDQLSRDLGVGIHTIQTWETTSEFWGTDRIPGCLTYKHYQYTTTLSQKSFLMKRGKAGCAQRTKEIETQLHAEAAKRQAKVAPQKLVHDARVELKTGAAAITRGVDALSDAGRLDVAEKARVLHILDDLCAHLSTRGFEVAILTTNTRRISA